MMNCYFLANFLMGTIYLFARKSSYIVLNQLSIKQRQSRHNPDIFCYICGEYIVVNEDEQKQDKQKSWFKPCSRHRFKDIMNDELLLFGKLFGGYYIFICQKI